MFVPKITNIQEFSEDNEIEMRDNCFSGRTFYHTFTKKKGCFEIHRKMNVPPFDPLSVDNLQVLRIAIFLIQYV